MTPYTPQEVEERFQRLPEALKEAMMSVENSERIFEVGKKFGLTVEQIGFLAEESGYVVLGLTRPQDFVTRVAEHLRVDGEKAKAITREINHQVFFPLKEILKNTHQFELTQEQIQAPPPPIPPITLNPPSGGSAAAPVAPPSNAAQKPTPPITPPQKLVTLTPAAIPPIKPIPPPTSSPSSTPPAKSTDAKTNAQPIMPPTPPVQGPQPTAQTPVSPPALPAQPKPSTPFSSLPPSTIQEKKPEPATLAAVVAPKSIEGIKPKESTTLPAPLLVPNPLNPPDGGSGEPQSGFSPLAPSQILQNKFLENKDKRAVPIQPEIQRIKESLFAPASIPAEVLQNPQPASTPQPAPVPLPPPPAQVSPKPAPRTGADPYREPLE